MNDRIYKLINQCFIGTTDGKLSETNTIANVEKFAELIVKECSDFVYNYPEKYLTRNQAREICFSMEKHFGVE